MKVGSLLISDLYLVWKDQNGCLNHRLIAKQIVWHTGIALEGEKVQITMGCYDGYYRDLFDDEEYAWDFIAKRVFVPISELNLEGGDGNGENEL